MTYTRISSLLATLAAAFFLVVIANPAGAQTAPSPATPNGPIAPKPNQPVQGPPPAIRMKVDVVNAPVVVHNSQGELVLDLTAEDFRIYDNGVRQHIDGFEMGGAPVSLAIVTETSSRIQAVLPAVRRTGILFTQTVLGPDGDAAVIGYDDQVEKLLAFTSDQDAIERTITNLKQGSSGARLYDALSTAVEMLRDRSSSRRRVIVTLAEAVDTGSEAKLGEVLRQAQLANITIYSIGLSTTAAAFRGPEKQSQPISATPPGTFGLPPIPGQPQTPTSEQQRQGNIDLLGLAKWVVQHASIAVKERPLEVATVATGGLYQSAFRDATIESAVDVIGGELTAQYNLSYRPTGTDPNGYHEIRVTVDRPSLTVRFRPGYYPVSSPR